MKSQHLGNSAARKVRPAGFQRSVLASACVVALGSFVVAPAMAQSVYTLTFPGTQVLTPGVSNSQFISNSQNAQGNISSTGSSLGVAVTSTGSLIGGTPVTVNANSIYAGAFGNIVDPNSIDLFLAQSVLGSVGILSGQSRANFSGNPIFTRAVISGGTSGILENGALPATKTVNGNSITAQTQLNTANNIIAGQVPVAFTSIAPASVALTYTGVAVSSTVAGPVQIGNFQSSFNAGGRAGSIATVDASTVTLDLQATAGSTASSPLTLTNNAIAANYGGNDATNRFTASAGGGTVLQGGVAVSNAQGNIETTGAGSDPTAYISNSTINADITSRTAPLTSLSAPLVVSNNSLSATSSGNTAGSRSATGTVAGNSITLAPGVDLVGNGGSGVATLAVSGTPVSLSGDAVLSSSQANQGTYFTSQVQGTAITPLQNGVVTVRADTIAPGGSINAADNSVNAAATGNFASNLVTANNANLTGSVAAGNLQINDATLTTGTVNFGSVTANVGSSAGPVSGAITSNKNTISASAEGNVAATSVALTSSNLTSLAAPAGASSATANANGLGSSVVTAGTSAANLQSNSGGGAIGSTVFNSFVAVNVNDQVTPANLVGLSGASVSATNNAITSDATGNNAATSIALAGTNGAVQSAVGNTQLNGSAISGRNLESGVIVRSADVGTSAVTLTGNTVSSAGTANNATNALTATGFANLTVGPNAIAASSAASAAADVATNNAALGIASAQRNTASVSSLTQNTTAAAAGGGFATVYAGQPTGGSGITGSNVQASSNTVSATTTGNRVANTVGLGGSTLDTVGNSATRIAAIANSQINDVTGVANATVDGGSTAVTAAGVTYYRSISDSNVIASANQLNATSLGNRATNSLVSGALGGGGGVTSFLPGAAAGTATGATAQQEFALVNNQADSVSDGRTALVQLSTVGVSNVLGNTGAVSGITGSTITADGNRIVAEARNNDATNAVALTGLTTLGSSIGLANQQSSATAVNARVIDSGVQIQAVGGILAGTVSSSNLTVSDNVVQGLAVGSSAQNSLAAGASTLSGNSGITASGVLGGLTPSVVADYALANTQNQSGPVTSVVNASNRVILAIPGSVGSNVTGGALVLSGNTTASDAQATSAVNNLALAATGSATGLTGAVGSGQSSSGDVSATLAGVANSAGVANITALSLTSTSATAAGNLARASAGQNEAFNTQNVSGASVAGSALAASTDFSVVNTQQGAGNVSSTANPGLVGVAANGVDTTSVTVSGNAVRSSASVNTGGNALGISATGTVAATGGISNSQTATTGVVSATQGAGVTPTNIGLVQESVSVPIIIIGGSQVTVTGNAVDVQASRNSITNQQVVTGATIAGGIGANGGLTQSFSTANSQVGNGDVTAVSTLGTVGAVVERSLGSNLTVAANRASAAASVNSATNNQTMAATSTLTGSGVVQNSQTSGLSAFDSVSATLDTATVGLAPANALTVFVGGTIAVTGNQLSATAGRNGANNALVATAATVGSALVPASFGASNSQSAVGDVSASNTVGTIGATANLASGNSFSITGNSASAAATSNVATTAVTLGATSGVYASATANNSQTALGGALSAAVNSTTVGLRGVNLESTSVTVSGNVLNAEATRNTGTNALTAAAPTVSGTTTALPGASFVVSSYQTGQGNVTTTNAVGVVGATQNPTTGGSLSVSDNSVLSSANVNKVANSLVLNAANGLSGTGLINNTQNAQAGSVVSATASGGSIGVIPFTSGNTLVSTPVTVSGNVIAAQGGGNTALNAIETVAVNTISGSFPSFPTYGLLNAQNNAATVTTTVRDFRVGLVAAAVTTTASSVVNNQASALSYGNTASNAVAVSALTGSSNLASTLINNTQTNSASISSAVTGVNIGVSGGSLSNGSVVVSGNAISARSVGNSASNIISQK